MKVEQIRSFVEKLNPDINSDDEAIAEFNEYLAETGKEYWYCGDCGRFHPRGWTHCDLPCTMYEKSRAITEEEWEELNGFFDPTDYRMDPYYIRFPHSKLAQWLDEAEDRYNAMVKNLTNLKLAYCCELWDVKGGININDLSCQMTQFEKALRKFEIDNFRGVRTFFKDLDSLLDFYIANAPSQ